ncbi:hypothetical protein D3C87_1247450 [compost metagenome]
MSRAGMRLEPGHTWGGSTLSGQRLQEPALLGLPMYEAHRSWQLPGQCRAAIITCAAHNRIWRSPALLLACAGPSLRFAVTAHSGLPVPREGQGRCGRCGYAPACGTDAAFALSATCAGAAWCPCHSCTGRLCMKRVARHPGRAMTPSGFRA